MAWVVFEPKGTARGRRPLLEHHGHLVVEVDVGEPEASQLVEAEAGVGEQADDGVVSPVGEVSAGEPGPTE
jgi:hypothetical protein